MSLVQSNMMELGTIAPDFNLFNPISGEMNALETLKGEKGTVVVFICNHCPYVHHINSKLVETAKIYQEKGISFIAISSNDVNTHPQDGPEKMVETARKEQYPFPYLYDETQDIAKAYKAECTPDFFVFDAQLACVYRGQFDSTRPNKGIASGEDLSKALDHLLSNQPIDVNQQPSIGCNIKWK